WDAYKDAGGGRKPFAFLPFVFSAYMTTIGLIFSADFKLFGVFIGPIWLPILSLPVGLALGAGIRWLLLKKYKKISRYELKSTYNFINGLFILDYRLFVIYLHRPYGHFIDIHMRRLGERINDRSCNVSCL